MSVRIKINGQDINKGDRVTFESSNYSDAQALTIIAIGAAFIWMLTKGVIHL